MTCPVPLIFPCLDMVRVSDTLTDTVWDFDPDDIARLVTACRKAAIQAAVEHSAVLLLRGPAHCRALSLVVDAPMACAIAGALAQAAVVARRVSPHPGTRRQAELVRLPVARVRPTTRLRVVA